MNTTAMPHLVAVLGTGTIGSSMTRLFLRHGLFVAAYDPDHGSMARISSTLPGSAIGTTRLSLCDSIGAACREADFVFEAGPERLEIKLEILRLADAATRPTAVIATRHVIASRE